MQLTTRDVAFLEKLAMSLGIDDNTLSSILPKASILKRVEIVLTPEQRISASIDEWAEWFMKLLPNLLDLNPIIRRFRNSVVLTLDKAPDKLSHSSLKFKDIRINLSNSTDLIPHTEDYILKTQRRGLSNPCKKCRLKYHHISHCPFDPDLLNLIDLSTPTPSTNTTVKLLTDTSTHPPNPSTIRTNNPSTTTASEEKIHPPKQEQKKKVEEHESKTSKLEPHNDKLESTHAEPPISHSRFPPLHRPMASSPSDTLPPRHQRQPPGLAANAKESPRPNKRPTSTRPATPGVRKTVFG